MAEFIPFMHKDAVSDGDEAWEYLSAQAQAERHL